MDLQNIWESNTNIIKILWEKIEEERLFLILFLWIQITLIPNTAKYKEDNTL